jgi:predicted nucleic acid-binding protein
MTRGLDTSVILRLVTNRPQPMASEVADYIRALLAAGDTFAVSDLVVSEAYFALQHHYDLSKEQAIESLRLLSRETGFRFAEIS